MCTCFRQLVIYYSYQNRLQPKVYFFGYFISNSLSTFSSFSGSSRLIIISVFSSTLSLSDFDCGDATAQRNDKPPICHASCRNSDCQFSIVSLRVLLK